MRNDDRTMALRSGAFARLVSEMRTAQKEYFRTRSRSALDACKQLEKQVDAALKEQDIPMNAQGKLF